MKIIYCIAGLRHSGGMERVLTNKANYLTENGFDVLVITTDQYGEKPFFPLSSKVRTIDLGVNYEENNGKGILNKILHYPYKQWIHRKRLTQILKEEKADIVISMFCNDASFVTKIKDGSKKILEIHFSRFKRLQYGREGIWGILDRIRSRRDLQVVSLYDSFVVLTQEDKDYWGNQSNITVIPNARTFSPTLTASLSEKRVIAVGRYNYQKGFDDLINSWSIVATYHPDWRLDIFGDGELRDSLENMIKQLGVQEKVFLRSSVTEIGDEYLKSSFLVMTSRYEGLPMVLLEAQSYGLPIVSYACKCGPRDIITNGKDGFLVPEGKIREFADAVMELIRNERLRKEFGEAARRNSEKYEESKVMGQWIDLFQKILDKK